MCLVATFTLEADQEFARLAADDSSLQEALSLAEVHYAKALSDLGISRGWRLTAGFMGTLLASLAGRAEMADFVTELLATDTTAARDAIVRVTQLAADARDIGAEILPSRTRGVLSACATPDDAGRLVAAIGVVPAAAAIRGPPPANPGPTPPALRLLPAPPGPPQPGAPPPPPPPAPSPAAILMLTPTGVGDRNLG